MLASEHGQTEVAQQLIQARADVNAKDKDGRTALYHAAYEGHMTLVQLLQEHGATDDGQIASAQLQKMIEVGVRRRGRQQDARAACASMQAVGVCDVRAWLVSWCALAA